jgi:lipopolysaccharide export system permease protein
MNSWDLLEHPNPDNLAELAWRVGLALAAFNMVLIALAMARINPRGARNGHLITAFFTFIVYYNLINLGQSWITAGRISFTGLLSGLHGGVFLFVMGLVMLRDRQWSWRSWVQRRVARPEAARGST